tara:strand:+ start:1847 stop:2398 length:552 start_codon:yes stop_codon:yes gene_type:complete
MNKDLINKFEFAEKLLSAKKYEESILHFEKILDLDPNLVPALYNVGLCNQFLNRLDKAEFYYNKCHTLKPDELRFINNLSTVYLLQKKFNQALPLLEKSLKINKNQLVIVHHTMMCLIDLDRKKDAEKFSSEKLKEFNDDILLNKLHARNLMNLNKHKEGLNYMEKATGFIEFDGDNTKIITN